MGLKLKKLTPDWLSSFLDDANSGYESDRDVEVYNEMLERRKHRR